ncbi:MAG TPA: cation diffusion facilitator family transporter [Actinomycetota bacterium]|nr:cation diffusion facilitator family transporter [Actinomycetota bacterium]
MSARGTPTHQHGPDVLVRASADAHGPSGGHAHSSVADALRSGNRRRLLGAFAVTLAFFAVELVAGLATNSLALLSDAGHMFTDVLGLGMALAAMQLAGRATRAPGRTYGLYRLEILAALANGVLLFGVGGYVVYEAFRRLTAPPEVAGLPMLVVAAGGLAANLVAFGLLRGGAQDNLNVKAAYLEVVSDALGSVAVIVAGVVLQVTGWPYVDPIAGAAIGLFILPRTWRLTAQALRILVQAAPPEVDLAEMTKALLELEGVVDVHDLHCWTLTSEMEVASAHLKVCDGADTTRILRSARQLLADRFSVDHATLQIEDETVECRDCCW